MSPFSDILFLSFEPDCSELQIVNEQIVQKSLVHFCCSKLIMKSEIHNHYFHVQIADFPSIFVVVIFIHTVSFNIHYHFWKFESLKITNKCCQYEEEKLIHLDTEP